MAGTDVRMDSLVGYWDYGSGLPRIDCIHEPTTFQGYGAKDTNSDLDHNSLGFELRTNRLSLEFFGLEL